MGFARGLLAPVAPRGSKPCQRPRQSQRKAWSSCSSVMEETNKDIIAAVQEVLLREKSNQSLDPSTVLQLLSKNPGLAEFIQEAFVQVPLHESTSSQSSSPTSSTCSDTSDSFDSCGWEEDSSFCSFDSLCSEGISALHDRYRRDASKLGSRSAIEFLELARSRLRPSEYAALLQTFCSFDVMEVTEEMEGAIWDLVCLDRDLMCTFQSMFPSLSRRMY